LREDVPEATLPTLPTRGIEGWLEVEEAAVSGGFRRLIEIVELAV